MNEEKQKLRHGHLTLAERILAVCALLILIGWLVHYFQRAEPGHRQVGVWFTVLSITGASLVVVLAVCQLYVVPFLSGGWVRRLYPVASLLPVCGYLIDELIHVASFFTVGGSIALAYISATTYWRKRLPDFVTNPLGESARESARESDREFDRGAQPAQQPPAASAPGAPTAGAPSSESPPPEAAPVDPPRPAPESKPADPPPAVEPSPAPPPDPPAASPEP